MIEAMLEFDQIYKSFSGVPVLRGVSFGAEAGRVLGLVGENGAGKSTLMNILGGVLRADAGAVRLAGAAHEPASPAEAARRGVAFIHQELNLFPNLSIAENLFITSFPRRRLLGLPLVDRRASRARAEELLAAVDLRVPPGRLVGELAPGERQLVEIAKALSLDARVVIFDEPTTSLTAPETERLFGLIMRLRGQGRALIYISHILGDIFRVCDDVVVLRDGEVVGGGRAGEFTQERLISLMVGRTLDQLFPPRESRPAPEPALEALGLSQPGVVEEINFTLHRGEVLGIAGLMGAGRSELARILFGLDPHARGEILIGGVAARGNSPRARIRDGVAFLSENRREDGMLAEASVDDNIALVALPAYARGGAALIDRGRLEADVARAAERVRVKSASRARQPVKRLSGGNQQKVVLAKWLLADSAVFILDEPTRGVDVGAKHEIYRIVNDLAGRGAGVLLISSEIEELIGMCDRIMVMRRGRIRATLAREAFSREELLRLALAPEAGGNEGGHA